MHLNRKNGQGLLEVGLILPIFLLLIAGSYVCCRAVILHSAAESAALTEAIRAGRRLPGIEGKMSGDILPYDPKSVTIRFENAGKNRLLPAPFPLLAGRTKGFAEIRKGWEETGGVTNFPALRATRVSEASVDCWEKRSVSGKNFRRFVEGYVATGVFR
jgi:hypothetical protein